MWLQISHSNSAVIEVGPGPAIAEVRIAVEP
jgi:hypothetical protein